MNYFRGKERILIIFCLCLFIILPASANSSPPINNELPTSDIYCDKASPLDIKTLAAKKYRVGEIFVKINPIFNTDNPDENGTLYQWANKVHFKTNEAVIRKDFLFEEGELLNFSRIKETERLLRSRQYNWNAVISVARVCGNKVDLLVTTRDVWTLQPSINFGRSGGANKFEYSITDTNFLGSGKIIEISRFSNVDREGHKFSYQDHDFLEDRWKLNLSYADTSDGFSQFIQLKRPFYALDTRWEAGANAFNYELDNFLYFRGEIVEQFSHRSKGGNIFGGNSTGYKNSQVNRFRYGFSYKEETFSATSVLNGNTILPNDRTFSYPWIAYEYLQDKFQELENVKQIGRVEDINLGWRINTSVGYSATTLGADQNRWVLSSSANKIMLDDYKNLWSWDISLKTNLAAGKIENGFLKSSLKYYNRQSDWHSLYANIKATIAENLYKDVQLTLGGDSGLRGYPLRYQNGNRRFLVTLEERFYTRWEILKLFNVGAAVFVDAGRAWFDNKYNGEVDEGILKSIGIGLRLSSTRTSHNRVLHIDLAKPVGARGDVKGLQWLVSLKSGF